MERNKAKRFVAPICFGCVHYKGGSSYKCKAFPDGIPDVILVGENDHSEPLPEQENDIVFEPLKEN